MTTDPTVDLTITTGEFGTECPDIPERATAWERQQINSLWRDVPKPIPPFCGRVIVTREWQGSVESTRLCERQTGGCPWRRADPRMQYGPTCAAPADPEED